MILLIVFGERRVRINIISQYNITSTFSFNY
eukprot:UN01747